jgi:glycosyltransferase involved in cell wall biosynthesis
MIETASCGSPADGKLRILEVCAVDGTAVSLLSPLMRRLVAEGYVVEFACKAGGGSCRLQSEGFRHWAISVGRGLSPLRHARGIWQLYWLYRRERFDVVHSHTSGASLDACIAAGLARVPLVLYTIHGFHFDEFSGARKTRLFVWLEWLKCRSCAMVFSQSAEDTVTAIRLGIVPKNRIETIGNGVDTTVLRPPTPEEREAARKTLHVPERALVVAIVARLSREKGWTDLFAALPEVLTVLPDVLLVAVSSPVPDEPYPLDAQQLSAQLPNAGMRARIRFVSCSARQLLWGADLFVLPSYREGMPRSILEAMSCGLPVVATDIRGSREEVVHGETGYLVPIRDSRALAKAIVTLARDSEVRKRMGRAGRKRAEERFDENGVLDLELLRFDSLCSHLRANRLTGTAVN